MVSEGEEFFKFRQTWFFLVFSHNFFFPRSLKVLPSHEGIVEQRFSLFAAADARMLGTFLFCLEPDGPFFSNYFFLTKVKPRIDSRDLISQRALWAANLVNNW